MVQGFRFHGSRVQGSRSIFQGFGLMVQDLGLMVQDSGGTILLEKFCG